MLHKIPVELIVQRGGRSILLNRSRDSPGQSFTASGWVTDVYVMCKSRYTSKQDQGYRRLIESGATHTGAMEIHKMSRLSRRQIHDREVLHSYAPLRFTYVPASTNKQGLR